jgi:hypothetical protein
MSRVYWTGYVVLGLILAGMGLIPPTSKWALLVSHTWTGTGRVRQSDIDKARRSYLGRFVLRVGLLLRLALGLTGASLIVYGLALSLQG